MESIVSWKEAGEHKLDSGMLQACAAGWEADMKMEKENSKKPPEIIPHSGTQSKSLPNRTASAKQAVNTKSGLG